MEKKILITIARQCGSGGREVADGVAKRLAIPLYDKEIIEGAAEAGDLHIDVAAREDEKAANSLLYTLAMGAHFHTVTPGVSMHMPINDRIFLLQSEFIRERAAEGSAIFIGRCADYVLREEPVRLSVFLHAPYDERVARVMAGDSSLSRSAAGDLVTKTDRRRSSYYNFYTGGKWGKHENYHLSLDTHCLGTEGAVELIVAAARRLLAD